MTSRETPSRSGRLARFQQAIFRRIVDRTIEPVVTDDTGGRPIIVVSEQELVSDVMARAARTGGCANLFVVMDSDQIIAADLLPASGALNEAVSEQLGEAVHLDAQIGFLVQASAASDTGLTFSVSLPQSRGTVRDARPLAVAGS